MISINKSFNSEFNSHITAKLKQAVKKSQEIMRRYEDENVFKSNTLNELLTDKFEYKGYRPDTVYVKDLRSGKPIELKVKFTNKENDYRNGLNYEKFSLEDRWGREIGEKDYYVQRHRNGEYEMVWGYMKNYSSDLAGVGTRLDQLQIERAVQLNLDNIPRRSEPQAALYHTKMGFLPCEDLKEITSANEVEKFLEELYIKNKGQVPFEDLIPVIVEKDGKFFIDRNKTQANANLAFCKKIIGRTNTRRIGELPFEHAMLELKGEQLAHWKKIVEEHPVLQKLTQKMPEY